MRKLQIFTDEFKILVKGIILCSWRKHKEPRKWNYPGGVGTIPCPYKECLRCGKVIKEKPYLKEIGPHEYKWVGKL